MGTDDICAWHILKTSCPSVEMAQNPSVLFEFNLRQIAAAVEKQRRKRDRPHFLTLLSCAETLNRVGSVHVKLFNRNPHHDYMMSSNISHIVLTGSDLLQFLL